MGSLKLGVKLILYISLLLLTTMTLISYISYNASKTELEKRIAEKLHLINDLKSDKIKSYFSNVSSCVDIIHSRGLTEPIQQYYTVWANPLADSNRKILRITRNIISERLPSLKEAYKFNRILLISTKGSVVYETNKMQHLRDNDKELFGNESKLFADAKSGIQYSNVYRPAFQENEYYMMILSPLKNETNNTYGLIGIEVNLSTLFNSLKDTTGLGKNGETYLIRKENELIEYISGLKEANSYLTKNANYKDVASIISTNTKSKGFVSNVPDLRNINVDAAWSYIPELDWTIVTKLNHDDSFYPIIYLRVLIVFLCFVITFFAVVIIAIFIKQFLKPILEVRNNMVLLAGGIFPEKLEYENNDEIKETIDAMNNLIDRLKASTEFAKKIGEGNLNAEFHIQNTQDVLSKSLLSMQKSLAVIEIDNEKRKWAAEGIALMSEIQRKNTNTIQELGTAFINELAKYIGAQQGCVYALREQVNNNVNTYYDLAGAYGTDRERLVRSFQPGQGIIGQATLEKKHMLLKDTALEFTKIKSGLGEADAQNILIVPMKVNEDVMGVLEFASFNEFEPYQIEFIEKVSEGMASSILAVKSSEKTQQLLEESIHIAASMQKQEEQLLKHQERLKEEIENLKQDYKVAKNIIDKLKADLTKLKGNDQL